MSLYNKMIYHMTNHKKNKEKGEQLLTPTHTAFTCTMTTTLD